MSAPSPPGVDCERQHPRLLVGDVPAAVEFYTRRLGFELGFTWGEPPTMAGVDLGQVQVFLEAGTATPGACAVYFVVGDADELHAFQRDADVDVLEPPGDRPWGLRDYRVRDPYGNELTFGHYIYTVGPRIPIERVDVTVRLERRLAALLRDLAEHKGMTVGACLEEMVLHTNEGVGPHTAGQLRRIQELKARHGIDYDVHASYRFEEE
jgi:catechol 2,3-dioxygenase-like lactoylglutathione lyase family enzyme